MNCELGTRVRMMVTAVFIAFFSTEEVALVFSSIEDLNLLQILDEMVRFKMNHHGNYPYVR